MKKNDSNRSNSTQSLAESGSIDAVQVDTGSSNAFEEGPSPEQAIRLCEIARQVARQIIREKDPEKLIQGICDLLIRSDGYVGVWFVLSGTELVLTALGRTRMSDDFKRLSPKRFDGSTLFCQDALRTNDDRLVVVDSGTCCTGCPILDQHQNDWTAGIPMRYRDQVLGVLCIATAKALSIDSEEFELLREIASNLAFALHNTAFEKIRNESEERYRQLFDNMNSGVAVYEVVDEGRDFIFKDFNSAGERIDGDSRERLIGKGIREMRPGVEDFGLIDVLKDVWKTGKPAHHPIKLYKDARLSAWYENYVYKLPSGEIVAVFDNLTTQKQADEELQAQKEILSQIAANFPNSYLYIINGDLTVGFGSGQEFKRQNLDPNDVVGLSLDQVFGDNASIIKQYYLRTFQGEETTFELCVNDQYQKYKTVPLYNKQGEINRILAVVENVTERRLAQGALRLAGEQLKLAVRSGNVGLWDWNIVLNELSVSPEWKSQIGYRDEELDVTSDIWIKRVHPEDLGPTLSRLSSSLSEPFPSYSAEFRFRHKNGSYRWIMAQGTLQFDSNGRPERMLGSHVDVTDRKQSEERFRAIVDGIIDGVAAADTKSKQFVMANRRMCTMLGYSHSELLALEIYDIHPRDALSAVLQAFEDQVAGKTSLAAEIPMKRKDGSTFFADVLAIPAELDGRNVLLGCFRDVTEKRQIQATLAQADRLSCMGMLAAGVAHEVNNPLSYVLYNLSSLSDDFRELMDTIRRCRDAVSIQKTTQEQSRSSAEEKRIALSTTLEDMYERINDALSGTRRIKDIVKGLGTFSRVEEDRRVSVDLCRVIDVALDMAHNEIKYRARVVRDFVDVPSIMASEGRLSQVFLNLLINAAHAIDEGNVEGNIIRIRTWTEGEDVCAEVKDTGKGIAPDHADKLFTPFFTTKEVGSGSGLGLAISKNIVESYGGSITVQSEVGKGSSFVVRIPVNEEQADAIQENATVASIESEIRGRILVVDDERSIRIAISRMLRMHDVVEAESGADAMRILEGDQNFDLILCDMMMSEISGMDLHQWLTSIYPELANRIIFVTGGAFTPRAREYLATVNNISLEKPFDVTNFKKIVNQMVRNTNRDRRSN